MTAAAGGCNGAFPPKGEGLRELLEEAAARVNVPAFVRADPVQFARRYGDMRDAEVASLLASTLAWGNRTTIIRDCRRLLQDVMGDQPHRYVMEGAWEGLPDDSNLHRTFFTRHLKSYLRGLRAIYLRHATLLDMCRARGISASEAPAWDLARALREAIAGADPSGQAPGRCVPAGYATSALKRLNMALRWLVRDDGIVDTGLWAGPFSPGRLSIPLDTHVAATARALGLLSRRANDRRAVGEIDAALRALRPQDPCLYDFALFGLGIEGALPTKTTTSTNT